VQAQLPATALPGEQHIGNPRGEFEHKSGELDPRVMFELAYEHLSEAYHY
jgi:hypothetical protein